MALFSKREAAAGPWEPDSAAPACRLCNAMFSFRLRRHHCRNCGRLVCGPCSTGRLILRTSRTSQPKRVCAACWHTNLHDNGAPLTDAPRDTPSAVTAPAAAAPASQSPAAYAAPFGLVVVGSPDGAPPQPPGSFFAPAAARNAAPLLERLRVRLARFAGAAGGAALLEVAAGSGQHGEALAPPLRAEGLLRAWQQTDADARGVASCEARRRAALGAAGAAAASAHPLLPPQLLDCGEGPWPPWVASGGPWDAVLAVNLLHIAPAHVGPALCAGAASALRAGGLLLVYGPFTVGGEPTTPSNAEFHAKMLALGFGLRGVEDVQRWGEACGLRWVGREDMPANNFLLVLEKA